MQVRLERGGPLLRWAALQFTAYHGQTFGEPPRHVKTVEDMESVGEVLGDGRLV